MKYVRCDSHCKFPAYDKEEVDNLFYKKENIAVLTTTGVVTENAYMGEVAGFDVVLDLPEGYRYNNCLPVNILVSFTDETECGEVFRQFGFDQRSLITKEENGKIITRFEGTVYSDEIPLGTTCTVKIMFVKFD